MTETWLLATLWMGLALIATLLSVRFGIATALSEILVGTVAQLVIGTLFGCGTVLGANEPWIKFLAKWLLSYATVRSWLYGKIPDEPGTAVYLLFNLTGASFLFAGVVGSPPLVNMQHHGKTIKNNPYPVVFLQTESPAAFAGYYGT